MMDKFKYKNDYWDADYYEFVKKENECEDVNKLWCQFLQRTTGHGLPHVGRSKGTIYNRILL